MDTKDDRQIILFYCNVSFHPAIMSVPEDCGPLSSPDNGEVDTGEGTRAGAQATYTCDLGFELFGESQRVCGRDGVWNGSQPECRGQSSLNVTPKK